MKKLRLIKPWRLRAVRQRVHNEEHATGFFSNNLPASAPRSEEAPLVILRNTFIPNLVRFTPHHTSENRHHAPVSDAIFVCSNRQIR